MLPRQPDHTSEALLAKLSTAKVMDFTSKTLRSGVVVWSDDGPRGSALLFLRGAPAVIREMVQPNTVPEDFNQVSSNEFALGADTICTAFMCSFLYAILPLLCCASLSVCLLQQFLPSLTTLVLHVLSSSEGKRLSLSEKKRKDYAFRRQSNEKPSIIPGCPGIEKY